MKVLLVGVMSMPNANAKLNNFSKKLCDKAVSNHDYVIQVKMFFFSSYKENRMCNIKVKKMIDKLFALRR